MSNEFILRKGFKSLGGATYPYVAVTGTYAVTENDYLVDCTSGTFNVTLPTAVGVSGKIYEIKNSGNGIITVNTTSSQTIDGDLTRTLVQYAAITIQSNGANWIICNVNGIDDDSVTYAKIDITLKGSNTVTSTVDLSANGIGKITLAADTAFSFTNFELNKSYLLIITANGFTPSWSDATKHVGVVGNQTFDTSNVFYVNLLCIDSTVGSEKLLTMIMKGV